MLRSRPNIAPASRVMRRRTPLILMIGAMICLAAVELQCAGVVPPFGVSWGDGNRPGEAGYSIELLDGSLIFETLDGNKPWAPGTGGSTIKFDGQTVGFGGFYYRRFDVRLAAPDGTRLPGTYGRQRRFWIAPGWIIFASLATAVFCRRNWVNARTREREANKRCRQCGYDLRATPGRCPECGTAVKPTA